MKSALAATVTELKETYDLSTSLRLIAEWNMNRYSPIQSITNGPAGAPLDDGDIDLFPITSVVLPDRPSAGIVKAQASNRVTLAYQPESYATSGYTNKPNGPRYITVTPDSKYKYWRSPAQSAGTVKSTLTSTIANFTPTVIYTAATYTNKIIVQFENSYGTVPVAWTIDITTDGTNWTTISTNAAIASGGNGRLELYRQANGTWGTTVYRENPLQIRGMRVNVTTVNKAASFLSLIEMSPRIESDLSAFLIEYSSDFSMSDHSFIAPLGVASSNTADVKLSNIDNRFTNSNPASLYYGLIDKNIEMRLDVGISLDTYTTVTKTYDWIRQFTMRVDEWSGKDLDVMTASLKDDSAYLQAVKPNQILYQNMTVAECIWRTLDSIGYTDYFVEAIDADPATLIPYFWSDGEKTVWEIIQELAEATQTAVYFDEYGVLQIKTRNVALNLGSAVLWTFDGVKNGTKLPDIVELDKTYDYEANVVNVKYRETTISEDTRGVIPMVSVWEPEGDMVLRASPMLNSLTTTSPSFRINPADAKVWPFTGVIQTEGEFMRYTSKGYSYYAANGTLTHVYISSEEQRVALDKLNPALSFKNYYNGYFWCGLANRGLWSSVPKAHNIDASGYYGHYRTGSGTAINWLGGWRAIGGTSTAKLTPKSTATGNTWYTITRGLSADAAPTNYGARMKFSASGYTFGAAGIVVCANGINNQGYYIELFKTSMYNTYPTARSITNEVSVYTRFSDGSVKRYGTGRVMQVLANVWYDIDVKITWAGNIPTFNIFVNGYNQLNITVPAGSISPTGPQGRWGVFTRGNTHAEFDYVYATSRAESTPFDDSTRYDRIHNSYTSNQLDTEWIYNTRTVSRIINGVKTNVTQRYSSVFIDDFGPIAHEVREMDVKFDVSDGSGPSLHSRLYFSNEAQIICPEYNSNPFGAKFVLANASRYTGIVNGQDNITYGPNNPIEQKILIYGRKISVAEEDSSTVRNESAILKRGEVTVDFASNWTQSKAEATELGTWITKHWAGGADEIEVTSFANPLLSIGDLVAVNFSAGNMASNTHKYFIVAMSHSYKEGLESQFTLRRARI